MLQVLLSQVHRLRALELLGRFLDLGPWAVNLALSVGIFPYVLKLLQASAKELRPLLVFIWAKILAVDVTCQVDLVCDQGQKYFLSVLQDSAITPKYRTLAAFVLASIVHNFPMGQASALQSSLVSICLEQINDRCASLRQWLAICLGHLWQNYDKARWSGVRDLAHEKLYPLLQDSVPEVRAAAVYALGTFISSQKSDRTEHANNIDRSIALTLFSTVGNDMSPIVRMELLAALQWIVMLFLNVFMAASTQDSNAYNNIHTHSLERIKRVSSSNSILNMPGGCGTINSFSTTALGFNSIYIRLWRGLLSFCHDPCPDVVKMAREIVMYIIVDLNPAKEAEKEMFSSSVSLPPSPNTRFNYLSGNSPPVAHNLSLGRHGIESVGGKVELSNSRSSTPIQDRVQPTLNRSRKNSRIENDIPAPMPTTINTDINITSGSSSNDENQDPLKPKPIVTTNYISWSTANVTNMGEKHEKYFTKSRCKHLDKHHLDGKLVRDVEYSMQNGASTLYLTQLWMAQTQGTPNLIRFHPFDEQIAVAYKDKVMVNDRNSKAIHPYAPTEIPLNIPMHMRQMPNAADVTSFEFINPSTRALVLIGHDDGCIRIWKPPTDHKEKPTLITGWQAINDVTSANRLTNTCGLITTYQPINNVIVSGSTGKSIRFWDPETEMKVLEVPTDNEGAVRVLTYTNEGLTICGFDDGCCKIIDKRCQPSSSIVCAYREHNDRLLECSMITESGTLFTGCRSGECVCIDFRKNRIMERWKTNREATAMAVYPYSNIVAIGSDSTITLYHYNGQELNRTRCGSDSGYRAQRKFISCLTFHPLKGHIASGYSENLVTAYELNDKITRPISYYW